MQLNRDDMADEDQLHCNRECSAAKASLAFHICLPVKALRVAAMIFFLLIKVDRTSVRFWYSNSVTVTVSSLPLTQWHKLIESRPLSARFLSEDQLQLGKKTNSKIADRYTTQS